MSEASTISGMRPVTGGNATAGHRDYAITLERDGHENVEISEMFNGTCQTLDPTDAIEFTTTADPDALTPFRVGDVIKMRVVINT